MIHTLITLHRSITDLFPAIRELKEECLHEIHVGEVQLKHKLSRVLAGSATLQAVSERNDKLRDCVATCEKVEIDLKILDRFVNGGI